MHDSILIYRIYTHSISIYVVFNFYRNKGKHLRLRHQQTLLYRTLFQGLGSTVNRSSDMQQIQLRWSPPTKSKSTTTHTLSLSMVSPPRMTLMQKSKWNLTPLGSTRTSMATSMLNLLSLIFTRMSFLLDNANFFFHVIDSW